MPGLLFRLFLLTSAGLVVQAALPASWPRPDLVVILMAPTSLACGRMAGAWFGVGGGLLLGVLGTGNPGILAGVYGLTGLFLGILGEEGEPPGLFMHLLAVLSGTTLVALGWCPGRPVPSLGTPEGTILKLWLPARCWSTPCWYGRHVSSSSASPGDAPSMDGRWLYEGATPGSAAFSPPSMLGLVILLARIAFLQVVRGPELLRSRVRTWSGEAGLGPSGLDPGPLRAGSGPEHCALHHPPGSQAGFESDQGPGANRPPPEDSVLQIAGPDPADGR